MLDISIILCINLKRRGVSSLKVLPLIMLLLYIIMIETGEGDEISFDFYEL